MTTIARLTCHPSAWARSQAARHTHSRPSRLQPAHPASNVGQATQTVLPDPSAYAAASRRLHNRSSPPYRCGCGCNEAQLIASRPQPISTQQQACTRRSYRAGAIEKTVVIYILLPRDARLLQPPHARHPQLQPATSSHLQASVCGSAMTGPSMPHASATDSYGTDIKTRVQMCAGGATQRKPLTSSHLEH